MELLENSSSGLDFGCGSGPALAAMLEESGHHVKLYDPFFFPQDDVLKTSYDFVTCTEVAEHFHNPDREFRLLNKLLKPGGLLGIMTSLAPDQDNFADWAYHQDVTHVVFYQEKSFNWISQTFGYEIKTLGNDVVIMTKLPEDPNG